MGDTIIVIVVIVLTAVLMFVFPLMTMADRTDDVSQLAVETATTEFVDDVRTTGVLTMDKYSKFVQTLAATGNSYDPQMELQKLDENPSKKAAQVATKKIGENVYATYYHSQIMDLINPSSGETRTLLLEEGDIFGVVVRNTNTTLAQQLKNFFYKVSGNDTATIAAEDAGIVTVNGTAD